MGAIYQSMFFLAIALLAISITVFVLAVSLLGRAVKLSVEEQERAERDLKEHNEREIENIQTELDQARAKGKQPDEERLGKILKNLKRKRRRHALKLWWIRRKPRFLRANWGALTPGAFFLTAIVLSALALYWVNEVSTASICMWLAVASMFIGICFVCVTLKVIEGVAKTSEETAFVREVEVFKTALRAFEEEKEPRLELEFLSEKPPLHIEPSKEKELEFGLKLTHGRIARKPEVFFLAPKGFDFPGTRTWFQTEDMGIVTGHITASVDFRNCRPAVIYTRTITIKAPDKEDTYSLWYYIKYEDFDSGYKSFEVVVE